MQWIANIYLFEKLGSEEKLGSLSSLLGVREIGATP
jgi:hypothetical protein